MKIHWQVIKKPSFIIGAIVLFFVLLFFLNRSGASANGSAAVQGPSTDPAAAQLAMAQIQAGVAGQGISADIAKAQDQDQTAIALATIAAASSAQQTAAQQAIAAQTIAVQAHGLDLQYQSNIVNNQAQIDAMAINANSVLAQTVVNANLQSHLADLQSSSFNLQAELDHVKDVRLHGGQRLAVLQNIINQNGAVSSGSSQTSFSLPQISVPNLTPAGSLS